MKVLLILSIIFTFVSCYNNTDQTSENEMTTYQTTGSIEHFDDALAEVIDSNAKIEIIAVGFEWSEGPLWIEKENALIFSDVPANTVWKWTESKGKEIYLNPSGYTDTIKRSGETGSNGLLLDAQGNLVLCQHGNRQMARMDAPLGQPKPVYITLADRYMGKRFNSPNDAVYNSQGELFFTDPPYGFESQDDDKRKELSYNGVFKINAASEVTLLVDSISRPNGIAFLPGEKQLIIACSDPAKPNWYIYDVADGLLTNGRIFYSALNQLKGLKGLPDGLKINKQGIIFASGPGGIWIFNSNAKLLGKIKLDESASNVGLSPDEKTLYITNDMQILRIKMKD